MKNYVSIANIDSLSEWVNQAIEIKKNPYSNSKLGNNKTIGMLFLNPSLRTRLSTQKAAYNLGMNVIIMNLTEDGWAIEFQDGTVMNKQKSEHIKEAAQVISQYCDIIAIRAFAKLENKKEDYEEQVLNSFIKYASVPIINMESSTGHPLQALTDAITIIEHKEKKKPKVVLSWVPHPKALPQAVANSFIEMMQQMEAHFVITHPKGYELAKHITKEVPIDNNQENALKDADFVYMKNWSAYQDYGKILETETSWKITEEKIKLTNNAKIMHCLPIRRNVIADDIILDSENSILIEQANNRTYAAQLVIQKILKNL